MLCLAEAANTTKKILKILIFMVRSDADLIDFNRFGVVVSRRAGIIRLIDFNRFGSTRFD